MAAVYKYDLNDGLEVLINDFLNNKITLPLSDLSVEDSDEKCKIQMKHIYQSIYGMGERFNRVNQKGLTVASEIIEKFCNQGDISYCPIPFFFTDHGFGVFVDTFTVTQFRFEEDIEISISRDSLGRWPVIYFFNGTPKDIIRAYSDITGRPSITPKWSFGPWMSANRWNTEEETINQLRLTEQNKIPHSVMVLEAWSDEATFYRFNEHGEWKNPELLVQQLLEKGIHLILWQIPVLKRMDHGLTHNILDMDWEYAIEHNLCIRNSDETPYTIPEDHWFGGSLLPDFTNPDTVKWWFDKREYLLDMGVAGFKTDGGEFVLSDDIITYDGQTGLEMRNRYASSYVEAYSNFVGKNRVIFSRAGFTGQQNYPMQWAGDQLSTWEEFVHILKAGLSIGLSGVPFWGFDIAGFAGPMPSIELYERATQLAVFVPVMQWHSEPSGGQFEELVSNAEGNNDRSPWNISKVYKDETLIERVGFHYNLRMNLLPYLYHQALISGENGQPMMKHLIFEYPEDANVYDIEDSFMLGDILIAPILKEGSRERIVYLPEGMWTGLWQMTAETEEADTTKSKVSIRGTEDDCLRLKGGRSYLIKCGKERIPAFIRDGGCLALNLGDDLKLGSNVGNQTSGYTNLCFYMAGEVGEYHFADDEENEIYLCWNNGSYKVNQMTGNINYKVLDKL